MQKIPGLRKFSNVTLKRGMTKADNEFFQWINTAALNNVERRNVTITMLDDEHNPVVAWKVLNAFPTKVDYGTLDAKSNDVAIQQIDLAIEGFSVEFS
jgi:phage tail-like protein